MGARGGGAGQCGGVGVQGPMQETTIPQQLRALVMSQMKPLKKSMLVTVAIMYVLRSCREPIYAVISLPGIYVCSVFTHLLVSTASWFCDFAVDSY
jgi:hypothetical protein